MSAPGGLPQPTSLAELEARLAWELECLEQPASGWVPAGDDETRLDVAVIGAGMAGLATGFALRRLGIERMRLYDRAPEGREGPWVSYARMQTLRSPKHLAGPAIGLPSLTFRAWFVASFGQPAWDAMDKIPRTLWMDYLVWFRKVSRLPVTNETELVDLEGDDDGIRLTLKTGGHLQHVAARYVVLANGRDGLGGPYIPAVFRSAPASHIAHTSDAIDFAALRGKTVAVIGAGASALDNAAEALEAGATRVVLLVRRGDLPRVNKSLAANSPGFMRGFRALPDAGKRSLNMALGSGAAPPPRASVLRAARHGAFAIRVDAGVTAVRQIGDRVALATPSGEVTADFVIVGTGFGIDAAQRPELTKLLGGVATWADRATGTDNDGQRPDPLGLLAFPALGEGMQFLPRNPGEADWVSRVYCMNQGALMSHGRIAGDVPAISIGATRVAEHAVERLFVDDWRHHLRGIEIFDRPELLGDEWTVEQAV